MIVDKESHKTTAQLLPNSCLKDLKYDKRGYLQTIKEMHEMINLLYKKQLQLNKFVSSWETYAVNSEAKTLADSLIKELKLGMKAWCNANQKPMLMLKIFLTNLLQIIYTS